MSQKSPGDPCYEVGVIKRTRKHTSFVGYTAPPTVSYSKGGAIYNNQHAMVHSPFLFCTDVTVLPRIPPPVYATVRPGKRMVKSDGVLFRWHIRIRTTGEDESEAPVPLWSDCFIHHNWVQSLSTEPSKRHNNKRMAPRDLYIQ